MIRIVTKKDGRVVLDRYAKPGAQLEDIVFIAECEVNDGYADYSVVYVDGDVYCEYET